MGEHVRAGDLDIWTEQVGRGPDVLLIGGLGDTVESWQFQLDGLADRYRLTAFDNRGAGRTAMPPGPVSVEAMADDAAHVIYTPRAHNDGTVAQFIEEELAFPHKRSAEDLQRFLGRAVVELIPGARFEVMEAGGPSALPGGPGGVERPRGCLLAGG
jgi:3-oxoadipate enol-lactonase